MKRLNYLSPEQAEFRLPSLNAGLKIASQLRLRAGDFILLENRICPVLRVSDCAAVVALAQPCREFTTIFGKRVRIQGKAKLVRISANSDVPILNRRNNGKKGGRK